MDNLWIWLIYPLVNVYESLESLESYFKGPVCLDATFGCQSWLGTCVYSIPKNRTNTWKHENDVPEHHL